MKHVYTKKVGKVLVFLFIHFQSNRFVPKMRPTLCDSMDCSPPGSSVHGNSQAKILEWVAIPFSKGSSQPRDRTSVSLSPALAGRSLTTSATTEV